MIIIRGFIGGGNGGCCCLFESLPKTFQNLFAGQRKSVELPSVEELWSFDNFSFSPSDSGGKFLGSFLMDENNEVPEVACFGSEDTAEILPKNSFLVIEKVRSAFWNHVRNG